MKNELLQKLQTVETIASFSKFGRFCHQPFKYLLAIGYRKFIYQKNKVPKIIHAKLFWGQTMTVALPAATDIFLTGGKSHHSEIRLAKFLIENLKTGQHFLDVGAHYGYFSLLAAQLLGNKGKIISYEPSASNFEMLRINAKNIAAIIIENKAVSNNTEPIVFYEFPNQYSEYSTTDIKQFEQATWLASATPKKVEIAANTIDNICFENNLKPQIIKIDVEGAEHIVIQGAQNTLANQKPFVVMEYLEPKRKNEEHKKAHDLLSKSGYSAHLILNNGQLQKVIDIDGYLTQNKLESDNIVYCCL